MRSNKLVVTGCIAILAMPCLIADNFDKYTELSVHQPIRIAERVLPPGRYILKLAPLMDRRIVQIFSKATLQLMLTTLAIPAYRINSSDTTTLILDEAAVGSVPTLRKWFYPGEHYGLEFLAKPEAVVLTTDAQLPSEALEPNLYDNRRPGPAPRSFSSKYAVLIGISAALDPQLALHYAAKDAVDLAAVLMRADIGRFAPDRNHVRQMLDGDATLARVKSELHRIGMQASDNDLVVIFYSAHGVIESSGDVYLNTFDTLMSDLPGTAFNLYDFVRDAEQAIPHGRIVVLIDACSSGEPWSSNAKGLTVGPRFISSSHHFNLNARTSVMVSSRLGEPSYESQRFQNGVFTHFLIEALTRGDGLSNLNELFAYISAMVPNAIETRDGQHPAMYPTFVPDTVVLGAKP